MISSVLYLLTNSYSCHAEMQKTDNKAPPQRFTRYPSCTIYQKLQSAQRTVVTLREQPRAIAKTTFQSFNACKEYTTFAKL